MRAASSWSCAPDAAAAASEAWASLVARLGARPDIVFVHASASCRGDTILQTLRDAAPGVPVIGGTTCRGVMTEEGFHIAPGGVVGLFGLSDPDGAYGVGSASVGDDPASAAGDAVKRALDDAGRPGEVPALVWMTAFPGVEEALIEGIDRVFGGGVPVVGGSAADDILEGAWRQFAKDQVLRDAIAVAVLFPSTQVVAAFLSGYQPTDRHGIVTRIEGRTLHEIDGRAAAVVYDEWTDGSLSDLLGPGGNCLDRTSLRPLGHGVDGTDGCNTFRLVHPAAVTPAGGLELFAEVPAETDLWLMNGSLDSLTTRAGRVVRSAVMLSEMPMGDVCGALVVYCGGCMLAVGDAMGRVVDGIRDGLDGAPFLGAFTFGEQGCSVGGRNHHGNLMISVVVFGR